MRLLQILLGLGVLGIGGGMIGTRGGLAAILPAPETQRKLLFQRAGMLLLGMLGLGVLAGAGAAAGSYSNLSAYLSRGLVLDVLLLLVGVFFYRLLLLRGEDGQESSWHWWLRLLFWAAVAGAQLPIWQVKAYHVTLAYQALSEPLVKGQAGEVSAASVLKALLVVLVAYGVARLARTALRTSSYLEGRMAVGIPYALGTILFYAIVTLGALAAILVCGLRISILAVLAGTAGIGLGLGLQDLFKNFVAGLVLILERPVAIGDFVEIGTFRGHIVGINLRSSTLRGLGNNLVVVPNSDLATSRVVNLTRVDTRMRLQVEVGVSYDSDLSEVRELLLQVAQDDERVLADPPPTVILTGFGDSAVQFVLWASVQDAVTGIAAGSDLRLRIWDTFHKNGISIPFPQRDLHIRSSDVALGGPLPEGEDPGPAQG